MKHRFALLSALKDSLLNAFEGLPPDSIREARRQRLQKLAPFPIASGRHQWPLPEDLEVGQTKSQSETDSSECVHTGLAYSMKHPEKPITLRVTGGEFRRFVYTESSLSTAVERIKVAFPNLKRLRLDDDYLGDSERERISELLLPVQVTWTQGLYIDGRHGR